MTEQDRSMTMSMIMLLMQNTLTLAQSMCVNNAAWDHATPWNRVAAQGLIYHLFGAICTDSGLRLHIFADVCTGTGFSLPYFYGGEYRHWF